MVLLSVLSSEDVSVCTALNHKNAVQRAIIFTVSRVAILYTLKHFFPKTIISLCMSEVQLKSKKITSPKLHSTLISCTAVHKYLTARRHGQGKINGKRFTPNVVSEAAALKAINSWMTRVSTG